MKKFVLAAFLMSQSVAHAVVIDENTFLENGGDLDNIAESIKTKNEALRKLSYAKNYLTVGKIPGCTATWIGDDESQQWSYILTAAHCIGYKNTETPIDTIFTSYDHKVIASGQGVAYVPKERIEPIPEGMGGASTDIAILKLPKFEGLKDLTGVPLEQPVIYDGSDELDKAVTYVGYGAWGVGLQNNNYWPSFGDRRLLGRSKIDSLYELDYGIGASYLPHGPSANWARTAGGDSGSAWWQIHNKKNVIIATTNGHYQLSATAARVSKYADWIKSIYPQARFFSAEKPKGCIVDLNTDQNYCITLGQAHETKLPDWIAGKDVYVQADNGVAVLLSGKKGLPYYQTATLNGTMENKELKQAKNIEGTVIDVSRPYSMTIDRSYKPLGCIISQVSADKYCLTAGNRSGESLPHWVAGHDVYLQADEGASVTLSNDKSFSDGQSATFQGTVENEDLKQIDIGNGITLDLSKPVAMRVNDA